MWTAILTGCLIVAGFVMAFLRRKNKFPLQGSTAVVTGGSQGLGLSIAKQFAGKGANVIIIAQNVPKLEKALEDVKSYATTDKQRFLYLSYDLRSPESGPRIVDKVTSWNNGTPPDIVLNCAGNCLPGFFASSSLETHRLQMDTVYWTSAYMAHAVLNKWTKPASSERNASRPPRHLVFTSSVAAFLPLAGYAAYTPAKAAMRAMADTLNQEVAVYNGARAGRSADAPAADIKIHILFPMGIITPGYENEQKTKPALTRKLEEDDTPHQPDELARILVSGLEAGQYMVTPNLIGHIMKGWAMGSSQRNGLLDIFWNLIGSILIMFVGPGFFSTCWKWGKEKGMHTSA